MASRSPSRSRPAPDAYGDEPPSESTDTRGYGTEKYGSNGLLFSSANRGWTALTAAIFRHDSGVLSWKNAQPDAEICVDLRGNRSVVTRTGGGIFDRTVARRGTIWMSPSGLQEDVLDISDPMPGVLHLYLPNSHFDPTSLGVELDKKVIESLRFESSFEDPLMAAIAFAIASELENQTSTGSLLVETLASSLAARLVQNYVSRSPRQAKSLIVHQGLDSRRLSRVMEYIEANLEGSLTLDEIASIACLSRFHFARVFKAAIGQSPHQYVSSRRLERAKELLLRGDRPLEDVAHALSFSSQANFSRAFRQKTGRTPSQFRRYSF